MTTLRFKTRPARVEDLDAIMNIQSMCYAPELVESRGVFECMLETSWVCSEVHGEVGSCYEKVIGYLLAHPWHDPDVPPRLHSVEDLECKFVGSPACFFIHDLTVHPEHRGLGVASLLLASIHHVADLCLVAVNGTAASFWPKHGFRPVHPANDRVESALDTYCDPSATFMVQRSKNG